MKKSCSECDRMPKEGVCHMHCSRQEGSDADRDLFEPKEYKHCPAPMYSLVYSFLRPLFHEIGYNLVCHGSMNRDLDLIAIPWVEDCGTLEDIYEIMQREGFSVGNPQGIEKSHGRIAPTFLFEWGHPHTYYIDLSIIPTSK